MIAHLKGTLIDKAPSRIVISAGGVGYGVMVPLSTYLNLGERYTEVELLIHTHMSDSSISLFGFSTEGEKDLFLKLIGISGIGPKIALNILSGIGVSDLKEAIRSSDIARISLVPGIGKKTAMRIALELAEKLESAADTLDGGSLQLKEDIISALMNLGFKRKEIDRKVGEVLKDRPDDDFESQLRECLRRLSKI